MQPCLPFREYSPPGVFPGVFLASVRTTGPEVRSCPTLSLAGRGVRLLHRVNELQRIALMLAGPDGQLRKRLGDALGQIFDPRSLGAVMTGQDEADSQ